MLSFAMAMLGKTQQESSLSQIEYTEYPDGRLETKARDPSVTDPKATLRTCQNIVKTGQNQLQDQLRAVSPN